MTYTYEIRITSKQWIAGFQPLDKEALLVDKTMFFSEFPRNKS